MSKINLNVLRPWINKKITDTLHIEEFLYNQLNARKFPCPKEIQTNLMKFLNGPNIQQFMYELWSLLVWAEESRINIPAGFFQEKNDEILKGEEDIRSRSRKRDDKTNGDTITDTKEPDDKKNVDIRTDTKEPDPQLHSSTHPCSNYNSNKENSKNSNNIENQLSKRDKSKSKYNQMDINRSPRKYSKKKFVQNHRPSRDWSFQQRGKGSRRSLKSFRPKSPQKSPDNSHMQDRKSLPKTKEKFKPSLSLGRNRIDNRSDGSDVSQQSLPCRQTSYSQPHLFSRNESHSPKSTQSNEQGHNDDRVMMADVKYKYSDVKEAYFKRFKKGLGLGEKSIDNKSDESGVSQQSLPCRQTSYSDVKYKYSDVKEAYFKRFKKGLGLGENSIDNKSDESGVSQQSLPCGQTSYSDVKYKYSDVKETYFKRFKKGLSLGENSIDNKSDESDVSQQSLPCRQTSYSQPHLFSRDESHSPKSTQSNEQGHNDDRVMMADVKYKYSDVKEAYFKRFKKGLGLGENSIDNKSDESGVSQQSLPCRQSSCSQPHLFPRDESHSPKSTQSNEQGHNDDRVMMADVKYKYSDVKETYYKRFEKSSENLETTTFLSSATKPAYKKPKFNIVCGGDVKSKVELKDTSTPKPSNHAHFAVNNERKNLENDYSDEDKQRLAKLKDEISKKLAFIRNSYPDIYRNSESESSKKNQCKNGSKYSRLMDEFFRSSDYDDSD